MHLSQDCNDVNLVRERFRQLTGQGTKFSTYVIDPATAQPIGGKTLKKPCPSKFATTFFSITNLISFAELGILCKSHRFYFTGWKTISTISFAYTSELPLHFTRILSPSLVQTTR